MLFLSFLGGGGADLIFVVNITTIVGTDIVLIILKYSNKCLYVKFCEIGYGYLILFHILAIDEFLILVE